MIMHDFRCQTCGSVIEHFVASDVVTMPCAHGCPSGAIRVILKAPKPDWLGLAVGDSASPEAVDKFERMHKQQAAKESKSLAEHGDYGPRPGAD